MKELSPKNAILGVFCILILCSCVPAGGLAEFLSDDKVVEFIEVVNSVVKINSDDKNLIGRNGFIEGFDTTKYYMFEKEIDGELVPVEKYGPYTYPVFATDYNGLGPGGLYKFDENKLGFITTIQRGIIFDLENLHTYTIRAAVPFDDKELSLITYKDDGSNTNPVLISGKGIRITNINGIGYLNLQGFLSGTTYEVMGVSSDRPQGKLQTTSWNWQSKSISDWTSFKVEGAKTNLDYVFFRDKGDGTYDFKVLSVSVGDSVGPPPVVSIAAIQGVTPPATGGTPVEKITASTQYTGTVSWSPALVDGKFNSSTQYTATITLTPTSPYTLTGVTANFFTVTGASPVTNLANSGVITAVFPATAAPSVITDTTITGLNKPVTGNTASTTITNNTQYTAGTVSWSPAIPADGKFASDTTYTATFTLTPKLGWTFTGVAANSFTVTGATSVTNAANSGSIIAVFPETDKTIDIAAIPDVTAPAAGVAAVTGNIIDTVQYTGNVSWTPALPADGKFAFSTEYTANITLTVKTGFTLTGVTENFFTVTGASPVTNSANSGAISAKFPKTEDSKNEITIEIIKWSDPLKPTLSSDTGTFTQANYYGGVPETVTINISPLNGYKVIKWLHDGREVISETSASLTLTNVPGSINYLSKGTHTITIILEHTTGIVHSLDFKLTVNGIP